MMHQAHEMVKTSQYYLSFTYGLFKMWTIINKYVLNISSVFSLNAVLGYLLRPLEANELASSIQSQSL